VRSSVAQRQQLFARIIFEAAHQLETLKLVLLARDIVELVRLGLERRHRLQQQLDLRHDLDAIDGDTHIVLDVAVVGLGVVVVREPVLDAHNLFEAAPSLVVVLLHVLLKPADARYHGVE